MVAYNQEGKLANLIKYLDKYSMISKCIPESMLRLEKNICDDFIKNQEVKEN